jgi:hypothetical protein
MARVQKLKQFAFAVRKEHAKRIPGAKIPEHHRLFLQMEKNKPSHQGMIFRERISKYAANITPPKPGKELL